MSRRNVRNDDDGPPVIIAKLWLGWWALIFAKMWLTTNGYMDDVLYIWNGIKGLFS